MDNLKQKLLYFLVLLELLAIATSSYLITLHYDDAGEGFCDISETFDCHTVNQSEYSELFGIPVALLGSLTFVFMLFLTYFLIKDKKLNLLKLELANHNILLILLSILIFSILFSAYLVYVELFILYTICLFCVVLDVLIVIMFLIVLYLLKKL
jgi:uncharacterized membrane protein|tara:strand:- start:51 stop:512 length:462 start_codon:yes stop_codon:yes gene_type:complete